MRSSDEFSEVHMGPRRTLQLSLVLAASIAILLALTGALSPAGAASPPVDLPDPVTRPAVLGAERTERAP
jgi:hypothetical protein